MLPTPRTNTIACFSGGGLYRIASPSAFLHVVTRPAVLQRNP
jgi:hypothetical protein